MLNPAECCWMCGAAFRTSLHPFVLSARVLAPLNVLSLPGSGIYFWGCEECLASRLSPLSLTPEEGFHLRSAREYVRPHSMPAPRCRGLEKLSASLRPQLDPADWPGASGGGGGHVFFFFPFLD